MQAPHPEQTHPAAVSPPEPSAIEASVDPGAGAAAAVTAFARFSASAARFSVLASLRFNACVSRSRVATGAANCSDAAARCPLGLRRRCPSTVTKSRSTRRTFASVVEPAMDGREELWARKASRAREDGEEEVEDLASPATTAAADDDGRCGLKWEETDGFAAARTAFIFVAASVPALRHVDARSRREEAESAISLGKRERAIEESFARAIES